MNATPTETRYDRPRHQGPPLIVLGVVFTSLFLASLVASAALAGGELFPSPFSPAAAAAGYFSQHPAALRWGGFLQFGAAIPLGLYTATVVSRLHFLGVRAAGAFIALFGGLAASAFLALSGLVQWVLADSSVAGSPGAARALHLAAFATGGPGHVVPLGLLVAGVAVTGGLGRFLPRWMMACGIALAAAAELSTLTLVFPALSVLLPLARFPAFAWLIAAGALLPRAKREAREARPAPATGSWQPALKTP